MGGTHNGAACEELQPVGRTHVGEVHGGCFPWEGPHTVSGKQAEESALGSKEWQRLGVMN